MSGAHIKILFAVMIGFLYETFNVENTLDDRKILTRLLAYAKL